MQDSNREFHDFMFTVAAIGVVLEEKVTTGVGPRVKVEKL